jgi:hypothetical protein
MKMKNTIKGIGLFLLVIVAGSCASVSTKLMNQNESWREQALVLAMEHRFFYGNSLSESIMCLASVRESYSVFSIKENQVGVIPAGNQTLPVFIEGGYGTNRHFVSRELTLLDVEPIAGERYVLFSMIDGNGNGVARFQNVDEYYLWWKEYSWRIPGADEAYFKKEFQKKVLSKFEKAEALLNKKK